MLNKNLINIITNYVGFYKNINFKISFFEQNLDKLDWSRLSMNPDIPFKLFFSEENENKIDWYWLSRNISFEYLEKYIKLCKQRGKQDKINWDILSSNKNIPYQFFLPGGRETVKVILICVNKMIIKIN
jgi:RNAse (barnase) inhibitor barstar